MIKLEDVKVKFNDKLALDIDGEIIFEDGQKIGIIGSNGAGKSTLIKAILGTVNYQGKIYDEIPKEEIAVHMQFNNYSENVKIRDIIQMIVNGKIEEDKNLQELIHYFDFDKLLNKTYRQLSGGEKQKLTLILVLWQNSPVTIFDEVTTGLDFVTRRSLMEKIVDYYRDKETTILLVSHYYEELENICDKLLYLDHGQVLFFGNKVELFNEYCAKSVVLADKNPVTEQMIDRDIRLAAMDNKIAVGFDSIHDEKKLIDQLLQADQNFQRLNESIELTVLNAMARKGQSDE